MSMLGRIVAIKTVRLAILSGSLMTALLLGGLFPSGQALAQSIIDHVPITNAVGVTVTTDITATYDTSLDAGTVTSRTFAAHGLFGGLITGTISVAGDTITLDPNRALLTGERVQVIATERISTVGGAAAQPLQWGFTAGPVITPCPEGFSELAGTGLTGVMFSSVAWGDYDNDGDLDVLLTGSGSGSPVANLYRNDGGVFSDVFAGLTGVGGSAVVWGDYDNDGDLDILLTGQDAGSNPVTKIYTNQGGGSFIELVGAGLTKVYGSSVAWGDYNNDGNLDILLTGYNGSTPVAKVYTNEGGGVFSDVGAGLTGVSNSSVAWGDYDDDGDLDILLTGQDAGTNAVAKVYTNEGGGVFSELIGAGLAAVRVGSVAWGDYDNDGDLDILLTGDDLPAGTNPVSKVYTNNGDSTFTELPGAGLTEVLDSSAVWGDYDGDGDLDILISGRTADNDAVSQIFVNNGDSTFTELAGAGLTGILWGSVAWGDYDNDGDQDILLTGLAASGDRIAKIYSVEECPPRSVEKRVNDSTPSEGDTLTFTISVRNGGVIASGGVISDVIPTGLTFVGGSTTLDPPDAGTLGAPPYLVSDLAIPIGDYVTLTYQTTVDAGALGETITNTVWVKSTQELTRTQDAVAIRVAPAIIAHRPLTHEVGVDVTTDITATYDAAVDTGSVTSRTFAAHAAFGGLITGVVTAVGDTIMLDPSRDLFAGERVQVIATKDIHSLSVGAAQEYQWGFTAGPVTDRCVGGFSELTSAALTGVWQSSVAWGDYDNDGDLDILLAGRVDNDTFAAKIYTNEGGGVFNELAGAGLTGVFRGTAAWGDYDNDGDLDILLVGAESPNIHERVAKIYTNEGGGSFSELPGAGLPGVHFGSAEWGDYDNDGDLDILLTGQTAGNNAARVAKIYTNEGEGSFSELTGAGLTGVLWSSVAWGDYDNDGDLDILLTGATPGEITRIYTNEGGVFTELMGAGLTGVANSSVAWEDYDNDGDLDILLTGNNGSSRFAKIYTNNGDSTFSELTGAGLTGVIWSSAAWGDYDNDGDLDILLTGRAGGNIAKIYANEGGGVFNQLAGTELTRVQEGSVAWGDYDNDGDLDILLTGYVFLGGNDFEPIAKIYTNEDCDAPALSIEKTVDNANPQTGDTITYTVVISNSGDGNATGAVISDLIPNGLSYVLGSAALEPAGAGAIGAAPQLVSGLTITAGQSVTLTFQATVNGGLMDGLTLTNTASVTATNFVTPTTDSVTITVGSPPVGEVTSELALAGMAITNFELGGGGYGAGILDWVWTILNPGAAPVSNIYFDIVQLDPTIAVVINADGGPAGAGGRVSVPNNVLDPADGQLDPAQQYDQLFEIGWLSYTGFTFQVQAFGIVGGTPLVAGEPQLLGTFSVEFDPSMVDVEPPSDVELNNQIFLPLIQK